MFDCHWNMKLKNADSKRINLKHREHRATTHLASHTYIQLVNQYHRLIVQES